VQRDGLQELYGIQDIQALDNISTTTTNARVAHAKQFSYYTYIPNSTVVAVVAVEVEACYVQQECAVFAANGQYIFK
jgi:hypothetical protein